MSDDGVPPGEEHDDSPWRPDAAVSFEHPPRRAFVDRRSAGGEVEARSTPDAWSRPGGRPPSPRPHKLIGLGFIGVLVIAIAVVSGLVWNGAGAPSGAADVRADDPSLDAAGRGLAVARDLGGDVILGRDDTPLPATAVCRAPRLPMKIESLWNTEIPDARRIVSPLAVGDDSVVAVVGSVPSSANEPSSVSVVALDLVDGRERWRAELRSAAGEIIGIAERTVIVRSAAGPDTERRRLFGFDEDTGEMLWERGFRGDWSAQLDTATGLVYVSVRRPSASTTAESEIEVIDAHPGDRVHIAAGALIGRDPGGRLVTRLGDQVLATSPTERDLLGAVVPSDAPFVALGTDVVVANGDENELSVYAGSDTVRTVPLVGPPTIDPPGHVVALESLGGSSLVVTGGGSVHGAQLIGDAVEIRWRVSGVVVESAATDRGRSLVVATEGGAKQRVVDSSTGRTIADLELRPGSYASLAFASNGAIVQHSVEGELMRVALDLDGRELWSVPGSGAVAIGRGVVVTVEGADATLRLTAVGDPSATPSEPTGCRIEPGDDDDAEALRLAATLTDR